MATTPILEQEHRPASQAAVQELTPTSPTDQVNTQKFSLEHSDQKPEKEQVLTNTNVAHQQEPKTLTSLADDESTFTFTSSTDEDEWSEVSDTLEEQQEIIAACGFKKKTTEKSITIRIFSNRKITKLVVHTGDKICDVKQTIEKELKVPLDQQQLFGYYSELKNDQDAFSELSEYVEYSLIQKDINDVLFIVFKSGFTYIIEFSSTDTVMDVKEKILKTAHVRIVVQRLTFQGRELNDERKLADYNIQKWCTVHIEERDLREIKIKLLNGDSITLEVESDGSETVECVKLMIREKLNMPVEEQQLRFEGKVMENDKRLKDYSIKLGRYMYVEPQDVPLLLLVPRECPEIQLFIKTAKGNVILMKSYPYSTIADLKASIQEQEGVPVDQQQLIFNSVLLEEEAKLLSEYGIVAECTLHLTTRMHSQFQIKVCWYDHTVLLEVESGDTIATLKNRIKDKTQLTENFILSFGDEELDDKENVKHYGIKSNSTLCLKFQHYWFTGYYTTSSGVTIPLHRKQKQDREILSDNPYIVNAIPPCTPFQMPIFVKMDRPHDYARLGYIAVGCLPTTTVKDVAVNIQSILKGMKALMSEQIILTFTGKEMDESQALSDYGIQRGNVLHLATSVYLPSFTFPSKFAPCQQTSLPLHPVRFPIFIEKEEGRRIPIAVEPHATVADVKTAIERREKILVSQQQYIFSGKMLEDKRLLADYGIRRECILRLVKQRATNVTIFLKVPTGNTLTLHHDPSTSIKQLKASIQEASRIPVDQQQLMFAEILLEDDKTLKSYDVVSQCTLYLSSDDTFLIEIQLIDQERIFLAVTPTETICSVKSKIQIREGILPKQQELFFDDMRLENCRTIQSYGIYSMATLILINPTDKPFIFVKSITGEVNTVEYSPSQTIADLKVELYGVRKILPEKQLLFFRGTQLEESQTLNNYNIQKQNSIHLFPQFSDCFQLHIKTQSGMLINFKVSPVHTVEIVKSMIWHRLGILPSEQCLYYDGNDSEKQLSGCECLSACHIDHESKLLLLLKPSLLFVKDDTGRKVTFKWPNHPKDTIADIKLKLCMEEGIAETLKLFLDSKELEDNLSLTDCSLLLPLLSHCGYLQVITGSVMFVKYYTTGRTVTLNYDPRNTVTQIQEQVVEWCEQGKQSQLIFGKCVLYDMHTLMSYNVQRDDLLTLIPKSIIVFVKTETEMCTILDVNLLDSVEDVKSKIQQEWGLPVKQQRLSFDGFKLSDDKALINYNIHNEGTLILTLHPWKLDQIAIEMPSKTIVFEVNLQQDTVEDIKAKIESMEGIPAAQQCLFLENLGLLSNDSEKSLADSGIKKNSALHLLAEPFTTLHVNMCQLHTGSWLALLSKASFDLVEKLNRRLDLFWVFHGISTSDAVLRDYNIHILSQLHTKPLLASKPVFIKDYESGEVIALEYDANETVMDVKQKSCEVLGIHVSQCCLVSRPVKAKQLGVDLIRTTQQLIEDSTLIDCNIKEGDTIDLVPHEITLIVRIQESEFMSMDLKILSTITELEDAIWSRLGPKQKYLLMEIIDSSGRSPHELHYYKGDLTLYHMYIHNGDVLTISLDKTAIPFGGPLSHPVFVKTAAGKTICLEVRGSETTEELKHKIERTEPALPSHLQRLIFNGKELKDGLTLSYYGIGNAATIDLLVRGQSLLVKMHMGKTIAIAYNSTDTIADVKEKIQKKDAILPARQKLFLGGTCQELKDGHILKDCNITANTTLNLILKRRMQIQVTSLIGETQSIMLDVQAEDTIHSIKLLIQLYTRAPPDQQVLYLAGCELNDWMTLSDYRIQHHSNLHLVLLQLHVRTPSGEEVTVRYSESETVAAIKAQLYADTRILPQEQRLLFCDQELEEPHTLGYYHIKNGHTLYLEHIQGELLFRHVCIGKQATFQLMRN